MIIGQKFGRQMLSRSQSHVMHIKESKRKEKEKKFITPHRTMNMTSFSWNLFFF